MANCRFEFEHTPLGGLLLAQRQTIDDARGFFSRFFCSDEFRAAGFEKPIVQINHTLTRKKGAVRGLHFQHPPHAEAKIVYCVSGEIFDVAVDLRAGSPTFLKWHAEVLSAKNLKSFMIPEGFAHGFQTLTTDCELIYLHATPFAADASGALNVSDPQLGIEWPFAISELSERDRAHPFITGAYAGLEL